MEVVRDRALEAVELLPESLAEALLELLVEVVLEPLAGPLEFLEPLELLEAAACAVAGLVGAEVVRGRLRAVVAGSSSDESSTAADAARVLFFEGATL